MLLPFYREYTIPQIIIEKLKQVLPASNIVLCTTRSAEDDALETLAADCGIECFRGAEDDVLQRFLDAAENHRFDTVIRVCADNPFLSRTHVQELIASFKSKPCDYISFAYFDGTPIMKGHIGLFAEIMRVDFLKQIAQKTNLPLYREHVTNYVYEHLDIFDARFIPVPEPFFDRKDIRLTIDTPSDFAYVQEVYAALFDGQGDFLVDADNHKLFQVIHTTPGVLEKMKGEIDKNIK